MPSWLRVVALGVAGLVVAAALGLVAHLITRETLSLSATTLQAGRPLAPPAAREPELRTVPQAQPRRQPAPPRTRTVRPARTVPDDDEQEQPERKTRTETRSENSGKGSSGDSDDSGSGSSNSGKGSRDD